MISNFDIEQKEKIINELEEKIKLLQTHLKNQENLIIKLKQIIKDESRRNYLCVKF